MKKDAVDLIKATFPGGSITGAPKIQSMRVINEIEKTGRGPYCGSIGYIGFNGTMDLSISIRTITTDGLGNLSVQGGGAVTSGSDPISEYDESMNKVSKILKTILPDEDLM